MSHESWLWAGASCIGTSHQKTNEPKQDSFKSCVVDGPDQFYFGIVCDGAGSAKYGGVGSWSTCKIISRLCTQHLENSQELPNNDLIWNWIDEVRDRLRLLANKRNVHIREFSTTMVCVVTNGSQTITAHIGDGAIVAFSPKNNLWIDLSWPEHGEYVSTTRFVTEDPMPALRFNYSEDPITDLALFSDGIERLALDFKDNKPFAPFFDSMLPPLRNSVEYGRSKFLSDSLTSYLSSSQINSRTDDDKTLILATRK